MSWICRLCETVNSDDSITCEVCDAKSPSLASFEYEEIDSNSETIISWKAEDADTVMLYFDGTKQDVTGVDTFPLTVTNNNKVSFCLDSEVGERIYTYELVRYKRPQIIDLSFDSDVIIVNKEYVLRWEVNEASVLMLNGEPVECDRKVHTFVFDSVGRKSITLIAKNGNEQELKTIEVNVVPDVVVNFCIENANLAKGKKQTALLKWSISNVSVAFLNDGLKREKIELCNEKECAPDSSTAYTITAIALDGITKVEKTLTVGVFDESEIVFKADKAFTYKDVPVTLSWNVKNAKSVLLDRIPVPLVGKKVVTTDRERQYVLEVEDEFGTKRVPLTIRTIPLPLIKTVLLPMPKIEEKVVVQQRIPAPTVNLNVEMKGLDVAMNGIGVNLQPKKVGFQKRMRLHPLSIKIGAGFRSRLKSAIGILANNVEYLKFENDEK